MTDVKRMLSEYMTAHRAREDVDPGEYLARVEGEERKELAALIDAYLARAPRREFDAQAFEASGMAEGVERLSRALVGSSGLWPALLPRLRNETQLKRAELVEQLARALGVAGREAKVADYYNQMEQGRLPAEGVSDRVLEALGGMLGRSAEALREAGGSGDDVFEAPAAAAPAFARMKGTEDVEGAVAPASPVEDDWDEVDELFRGRT